MPAAPSPKRPLASIVDGVAALGDAVVAPLWALRPSRRRAAEVLSAAGLPTRGAYLLDVRTVSRRRRHRRLRHRLRRDGPAVAAPGLRVVGLEHLETLRASGRGGLLLGTHGGPPDALPAALRVLGVDVFEVREAAPPPWDPPLRCHVLRNDAGPEARAAALVAGLRVLRAGGLVRLTLEGHGPRSATTRHEARLGEVAVPAAGGAAMLARASGAASLCAVASVSSTLRLTVRFGPPLALPAPGEVDEPTFAARYAEAAHAAFDLLLADDPVARLERVRWSLAFHRWEGSAIRSRAPDASVPS